MSTFLFENGFAADGAFPQVDNVSITSNTRFSYSARWRRPRWTNRSALRSSTRR